MSIIPWLDDIVMPHSSRRYQLSPFRNSENYLETYLPREILRCPMEELANLRNLLEATGTFVNSDGDKFQANVDVQQFKPEEISVKVTDDNAITIEAKHEEKPDQHGFISRHFIRKYVLPKDCNIKQVQSKLSSDGVLTITAPKIDEEKTIQYREIPITRTGQPLKRVQEQNAQEEPKK